MKRAAASAFEACLSTQWESTVQFLTYLETERLAADATALVLDMTSKMGEASAEDDNSSDPRQSLERAFEQAFSTLVESQAAVMTVKGDVRDDFLKSMYLSRT